MSSTEVAIAALPLTDATALEAALDSYGKARTVLVNWIGSNLVPGVDHRIIHSNTCKTPADQKTTPCRSCGRKASLLKPGSEKVDALLRVVPIFHRDQETWEMLSQDDRDAGTLCYVCHLHQVDASGPIVGEGRGARATAQDRGVVNSTIKMAQKSAQIDATIRIGCLSDVFTQDIEDLTQQQDKPAFGPAPRKAQPPTVTTMVRQVLKEAPPPPPPITEGDVVETMKPQNAISEGKVKVIYAKLRGLAAGDEVRFVTLRDALKAKISTEYGVEHLEWMDERVWRVCVEALEAAERKAKTR